MPFGRGTAVAYLVAVALEAVGVASLLIGLVASWQGLITSGVLALAVGGIACDAVLRTVNRCRVLALPVEEQPVFIEPGYQRRRLPAYFGIFAPDAWRALRGARPTTSRGPLAAVPSVSLRRVEVVELEQLAGRRLLGVTAAVHEFRGERSDEPVHLWLHLGGLGVIQCHCAGSGALDLRAEQPYDGYDMQEHGRVIVVPHSPGVLAAHVGEVVVAVAPLWQEPPGMSVGLALTFATGAVGVANLGDSLVVEAWPGPFPGEGVSTSASG